MKIPIVAAALFSVVLNIHAQNASPAPVAGQANRPAPTQDTPYTIVQSDANSRVWERTAYEKSPSGEMIPHVHSYTELGTGMHYQQGNHWVESQEQIEIDPKGGAKAIRGQHQAHFPYNIYDGVIEIVTPEGEHLQSRPLGISYFDGTNSVMIAELTNSVGQLLASGNQVIYINAFTDFAADLLVTYRKGGLECDLIFREQPPAPTAYGLAENSRLELFTEFFNTPEPVQGAAAVNSHNGLPDSTTLEFGSMKMIRGKAFTIGNDNEASMDVPVSKTWTHLQGRTVLIEELPVQEIESQLQQLPAPSGQNASASGRHASASRQLPPQRLASLNTNAVHMAKAALPKNPGFVLDYNLVLSQTNFTFQSDTTYYVRDPVNLSGTTTIEGNTVIKCQTNLGPCLNILGTINCLTAPYRPAVITSSEDSSVGETLPEPIGYNNTPYFLYMTNTASVGGYFWAFESDGHGNYNYFNQDTVNGDYYHPGQGACYGIDFGYSSALNLMFNGDDGGGNYLTVTPQLRDGNLTISEYYPSWTLTYGETGASLGSPAVATGLSLANGGVLHDMRFCTLTVGISSSANYSITNAQFINCGTAFQSQNATLFAGNILMNSVGTAFDGASYNATVEHLTFDLGTYVAVKSSGTCAVTLINSLLTSVASYGNLSITFSTNKVVKLSSSSGVYQTMGGGKYYLATNSVYRGIGTNVDAGMAAQLAQKTTYPPIAYANVTFTNALVFSPQAPRDTNASPDLGYHYDPLDDTFGGCTVNSNITFTAGTAAGWLRKTSGTFHAGYGIHLADGAVAAFNGTVSAPDYWVRLNTVQEQDNTAGTGTAGIDGWTTSSNNAPILRGTFLHASTMASEPGNHFAYNDGFLNVQLTHSEVYSGGVGGTGTYSELLSLTNCLFDRCVMTVYGTSAGVAMRNNLMHAGQFTINHTASSAWAVDVKDSAFDGTTISVNSGSNTNLIHYDYNAFKTNANRLSPNGAHDVIVTNFNWQTGSLGNWYQSPGSSLINTGSVTADLAGLYHFTTQTNQVKETNSVVDIGYHYVALDGLGNPDDLDGDGVADYLEDSNGNGLVDSGESSWLLGIISQPQSQNVVQGQNVAFSVIAGGSTPFYYQWRTNGVNLAGATSSSLTKLVVTTNDEANYSVVITNSSGAVTSSIAVLSVNIPLQITGQPNSQTVLQGTNVSFSAAVRGNYPAYQWYTNGAKINNGSRIAGATSGTLTISNVAVSDELNYVVVVTNLFNCVTSSPAGLTVIAKPGISSSPTNTTAIQSDDVTLRGLGTGEGLYYQWWLTNGFGTNAISGATQSNYTKLVVQTNDAGHYCLTITNLAGSTNGNADLTVLVPPWIVQQPISVVTNQGSNATFSISAIGTTNLFYQWYKNGTNAIANATNASLNLNNVQAIDAAGYACVATNIAGTNMSAWAWLSVNLSGGGTTNGWGSGTTPSSNITVTNIGPTNSSPTNPAIYLYGTPISIRASALSQYSYITNVAFYFTGTNYGTNFQLAGNAVPGANTKFALAWTNALPGTNILKARAWDSKGNTNDSGLVYVIMDRPPVVTTVPASISIVWEGYKTNVWFTNYVSDDGLPYGITNLNWTIPSGVTTSNVNTYTSSNLTIATQATFTNSGTFALTLNVSDNFVSTNGTCNVVVKHRPVISFNWPTNNATIVTGSPIVLNATATDPDGTVTNVTFYTNATAIGQAIPSVGSTYTYAWYSAPLWTNLVSAVAWDNDGLTSTSTVSVVVVPPLAVQFVSPTNNQFFVLSPTNIYLTALPTSYITGASISSVLFSNVTQSVYLGAGTLTNSTYQTLWTDLTNGTYTLSVTARDNVGNVASNGVVITVNAMPVVHITVPATNLQSFAEVTNVTLTATATDADGTITNVEFYGGTNFSTLIGSTTNSPYSMVWSNRSAGYQGFTAVATDNHGAKSVSEIRVFKVTPTNPQPVVWITFPTNGASFAPGSDLTITATATNYPASVSNVEFLVNGENIGNAGTAPYAVQKCCWTPGTYNLAAIASDNSGKVVASSNISITIVAEVPSGSGFWDGKFGQQAVALATSGPNQLLQDPISLSSGNGMIAVGNDFHVIISTNETDWTDLGTPFGTTDFGVLESTLIDGTNVYVTGGSTNDDYHIFRWDWSGSHWIPIGNKLSGSPGQTVKAMARIGGDLYVGGTFTAAGTGGTNASVQYVARLDSTNNQWLPVGNGLNGEVHAIGSIDGEVYAGGSFTNAGGNTNASYIAKLAGNVWTNLGSGLKVSPDYYSRGENYGIFGPIPVKTMAACAGNLYVGGQFVAAGSYTNAHGIAIWNPATGWHTLNGGPGQEWLNSFNDDTSEVYNVDTISLHGNRLFIGGDFTNVYDSGNSFAASFVAMAQWSEDEQKWQWADLDQGIFSGDYHNNPPGSSLIINADDPDKYDYYIVGKFESVGSTQIPSGVYPKGGFARWRIGYPQPPAVPVVTNVSPVSPAIFTNLASLTNILLVAQAQSTYTNFQNSNLHFYTNGVEIGSSLFNPGETNNFSFTNEWDNPSPGLYVITSVATDEGGLIGQSAPLVINIKSSSNSIAAVDDQYAIPQGTSAATLPVLTNDSPSSGLRITNVTMLHNNLGAATISHDGTYLTYTPLPNVFGTDVFFYTVSDGNGHTDSASVTVKILARPVVTVTAPGDYDRFVVSPSPITVKVEAVDYDGTNVSVVLYTNNAAYKSLTNLVNGFLTTNWTASVAGYYTFTAVATDNDGLSTTSAPVTLVLTNTTASSNMPVAIISNLVATVVNNQGVATENLPIIKAGLFDLQGRASDADGDPVSYAIQLFRPQDWDFSISDDLSFLIPITDPFADVTPGLKNAQGFHIGGDTNGDLGNLDLTGVPDGVYDLVLSVRGGTDETNAVVRVQLQSNLKIGQFSFSEQDLVLPVNGIPLTVTRTYNSLNPESGPFGASWTFALNDMDVKLDDERTDVVLGNDNAPFDDNGDTSASGLPKVVSMRTGGNWDVTLTLPDGRPTTFTFGYTGAWPTLHATWTALQGITAKLETINQSDDAIVFGYSGLSVPIWQTSSSGLGNPQFENQDFPGWVLTTQDGTKYKITRGTKDSVTCLDPNGSGNYITARVYGPPKLTEINELSTNKIVINDGGIFNYDSTNALTRWTLFDRDSAGRIVALHDPNGGSNGLPVVQYVYNNDTGNLIQVLKLVDRNADTYTTNKYHYDSLKFPHYITSIENGDGVPVARNFYDDSGRLTAVQDANGTLTQFQHNITNNVDVVIDRLGHTNSYVYDPNGNITATTNALNQVTLSAYDVNNNKTNEVVYANGQPYSTNSFVYDGNNYLLSSTDPLGHSSSYAYNNFGEVTNSTDALGNSTTNYYDPATGELFGTSDALGNTTTNFYFNGLLAGSRDAVGMLTTNYYDGNGNLAASAVLNSSGTILSTNSFGYDANGNQINSTVWRRVNGSWVGATTTTIYDAQNRVLQTIDANGGTNTMVYDATGKQQMTIDTLGHTNSNAYDFLGRLIQTTYPDGSSNSSAYDAGGNRISSTDPGGRVISYFYDALNRLTNTVYADNTTNTTVYDALGRVARTIDALGTVTAFGYDIAGRRLAVTNAVGTSIQMVSQYSYDANGNQIVFTDAANHSATNVYDGLNRQVRTLFVDGMSTGMAYDGGGRRVAETNQDGIVTLFGYDGAGRLVSVTNALGKSEQMITRYIYDEAGNEVAQIDALNRTNVYAYDGLSRRVSHTMPDTTLVERFGYDLAGNVTYQTNFNGVIITNRYDVLNRLTNCAATNGYQVNYGYSTTGQRTNMTDLSGSTGYAYDNRDRLTNKAVSWTGGSSGSLNYRYDANGNLTNLWSGTAGGATNNYQYDALSRLTNVLGNGGAMAGYTFDGVGNLQTIRYGNGVTNVVQYDSLNRLTNLVWKLNASSLASFYYQIGLTGNRTNLTETVNGTNRTYGWAYDSLYRLKQETLGGGTSGTVGYGFDGVGNRTNRTSSVTGLGNQTSTFNTNDWLVGDNYDKNGNTTNSAANYYQYDALNHITNVNSGTVLLKYDGDGNRTVKTIGGTTTYYLVDDRNPSGYAQVLEEYQGSTLAKVYNYGLQLISQRQPSISTNYFIFDGHGSTRILTDTGGNVANAFAFDSFGTLIASTAAPQTAYLYTSQQFDSDLGFYYLRARYYKPDTGRFWSMDSYEGNSEDPLSLHKYLYCQANPVNMVDPHGEDGTVMELNVSGNLAAGLAAFTIAAVYEAKTHALSTLTRAVAIESISLGDSVIETARSAIRAAGKSIRGLIEEAKTQIGQLRNSPIKVIPMPRSIIPGVAAHIASAQSFPTFRPVELVRCTAAQAVLNRENAVGSILSAGPGYSLDEYPFASSIQGGLGASVAAVPFWENCVQGGIIGACYGIEKITPGTPYFVVVTP